MNGCSADELAEAAKCLSNMPTNVLLGIIANLLCEGGGGGGGGTDYLLTGVIDPVPDPADTTKVWRYTNTLTGTDWVWPANGPAWIQIV